MPLYQVNAGDRALAADVNQFFQLLKGVAASGENITLIYNAGALTFQPSSDPSAGTRVVTIKNNAGTTLASWRYDGLVELLSAATAPATAVAGSLYWDSLLAALRINDGTNWRDIAGSNAGPLPNLVLNSDFSRRTVFGLAMPEVFADTSGATAVDGSLGSVASNVLTAGTNGTWSIKWCGTNATFYRDARFSFLVKQNGTGTTNVGRIGGGKGDGVGAWTANNGVYAVYFRTAVNTVTLELIKVVAGVTTVVASSAGLAWTDGRVGWAEVEGQGTTYIAKLYDQGSGTPGVKSAATLLGTVTGTIADAGVVSGQPMAVNGSGVGAATVWGGVSTGNGGVYVETWLPESYSIAYGGTLGGIAIGFDEVADAGPIGKQWAMRVYVPATSRTMTLTTNSAPGSVVPSGNYAASLYIKTSGTSGTGGLIFEFRSADTTGAAVANEVIVPDVSETSWTRRTSTAAFSASAREVRHDIFINPNTNRTGTYYFLCSQFEQGSAATAWRNAPADDAPIVWELTSATDKTTTSAAFVSIDDREYGINAFAPWDCSFVIEFVGSHQNSGANSTYFAASVDGVALTSIQDRAAAAGVNSAIIYSRRSQQSAGKHRIVATWATVAGTVTLPNTGGPAAILRVTAFRGK